MRDPRIREALAGEYVIGTMSGAARRRFERVMADDPRLRAEVELWQQLLQPLVDAVPERKPPAATWAAISERIGAGEVKRHVPFWQRLPVWRTATGLAFACALAMAVALGVVLEREPELRYVAVVLDAQSRGAWLVALDPQGVSSNARAIIAQSPGAGRAFELWLLPASGSPQSLGLLDPDGQTALEGAAALERALPGAKGLAVSIEPAGGSPTGQPTGPVAYQGELIRL